MAKVEGSNSTASSDHTLGADNVRQQDVQDLTPVTRSETHARQFWKFKLRPDDDGGPQDWWFASMAIPLIAATSGPLANVMSIAALITTWRVAYDPENPGVDSMAVQKVQDPRWCVALNAASLVCGFAGNIFLLFNFTRRVRYIVALPATIILWYFATGILMAITISMNKYEPPHRDDQTYSQGFWHAIIAAALYLMSSMLLMINMQGYFFGHYPQHFELTDEQRNLILQTMMFFIWLAGGAGVFARVEGWSFVDSLYFCDVTILTVGFGDLHPNGDVGRGLVFPYSVGGIIILGLMVGSIAKFAADIGRDNIIKKHVERRRTNTLKRSVTVQRTLEYPGNQKPFDPEHHPQISKPFDMRQRSHTIQEDTLPSSGTSPKKHSKGPVHAMMKPLHPLKHIRKRRNKLLLLEEEKDRFTQMRRIQHGTHQYKQYYALTMSVIAFGILWCVGAVGFWQAEKHTQGLSYFQALYFCYVSLLTIGYGDLSPTSNAGKPFFIVWSLIAVPTMTILISDMGDTVIQKFKKGTFTLADWTVLPKQGLYRAFLERHPWLLHWMQNRAQKATQEKHLAEGFPIGDDSPSSPSSSSPKPPNSIPQHPTLSTLATLPSPSPSTLARYLALTIRDVANDLSLSPPKHYSYEDWVEYTRLIRFSRMSEEEVEEEEDFRGLVEWDWLGEDSPMMSRGTEAAWVLDRLCESLERYMRREDLRHHHRRKRRRGKGVEQEEGEGDGGGEGGGGSYSSAGEGEGADEVEEVDQHQHQHQHQSSEQTRKRKKKRPPPHEHEDIDGKDHAN